MSFIALGAVLLGISFIYQRDWLKLSPHSPKETDRATGCTRATWGLLAAVLATSPAIPYFKYQRPITAASESGQHYAVVDEAVWQHALPNLDDLRLYAAGKEIPYAGKTMWGSRETEQKTIQILQPASLGGNTTFLLDMSGVPEYDRITLALRTKNFVAHAQVEGQDDPHGSKWAKLGASTLFDLSDEKLGHNSTLQIPVEHLQILASHDGWPRKTLGHSRRHGGNRTGPGSSVARPCQRAQTNARGQGYGLDVRRPGKYSGGASAV